MSDILKIDTAVASGLKQVEEKIEPLQVYDDGLPLLSEVMPEYIGVLPNAKMTKLTNRLKMTMKLYSGLGLSANQCGIKERVFVIGTDQFQMACINPKIINVSTTFTRGNEGCLSYPALFLNIPRPSWIEVEYTDVNGKLTQAKLDGLTARCYAHELEHLNGLKFTSHAGPVAMLQAKRKQEKLIKKIVRRK